MEDLTLPEPARTLLARTRGTLDAYVTPRTPDRSGWRIGGRNHPRRALAAPRELRHRPARPPADGDAVPAPRSRAGTSPSAQVGRRQEDHVRSIQPDPVRGIAHRDAGRGSTAASRPSTGDRRRPGGRRAGVEPDPDRQVRQPLPEPAGPRPLRPRGGRDRRAAGTGDSRQRAGGTRLSAGGS